MYSGHSFIMRKKNGPPVSIANLMVMLLWMTIIVVFVVSVFLTMTMNPIHYRAQLQNMKSMNMEYSSVNQIDSLNNSFEDKLRTLKQHEYSISKMKVKWARENFATNKELIKILAAKNRKFLDKKKVNISHKRDKELFRLFESHNSRREDLLGMHRTNGMKKNRTTRSHSAPRSFRAHF